MNEQALKVLRERRSIRKFKPRQIDDEDLNAVLEAGTYAPSAMGKQSAIIIAVQNKDDIAQLSRMNAEIMDAKIDPYYGAPTVLLVLASSASSCPVEDGCVVMTYLLIAAAAAGLGACWVNREKQMFDSDEGKALLRRWGVTGDYIGVAGCALGYMEGSAPSPAPRKMQYVTLVR